MLLIHVQFIFISKHKSTANQITKQKKCYLHQNILQQRKNPQKRDENPRQTVQLSYVVNRRKKSSKILEIHHAMMKRNWKIKLSGSERGGVGVGCKTESGISELR